MNTIQISNMRQKTSILDKSISKGKGEINMNCFALLFSELVQYSQGKAHTVTELQKRLSDLGQEIGTKLIDLHFLREKNSKREIKLLNMLLLIKSTFWKSFFGREADKLEHSNEDDSTYYIIEKEPLVNKYISVPKDKGNLNCAIFVGGIIEGMLNSSGFSAKVTAHWHKGTTYMVKFEDHVITRDKQMEER